MIKFRLISHDGAGLAIVDWLQNENNIVDAYIEKDLSCPDDPKSPSFKELHDGIIPKIENWYDNLDDDIIFIIDTVGLKYHKNEKDIEEIEKIKETDLSKFIELPTIGDALREQDFKVIGGGVINDMLELDRSFGQEIAEQAGFQIPPSKEFNNYDEAIKYVDENKKRYILKPSGNKDTFNNYPAKSWEDMLVHLRHLKNKNIECDKLLLQEYIEGEQMSIEGWWNGKELVGLNSTFEHKSLYSSDVGPLTGECGSLVFYYPDANNKLCQLVKQLEPILLQYNYPLGPIDCNFIHNEQGSWFLEFTARFGYPAQYIQLYACDNWGEIFEQLVDGQFQGFKTKPFKWFLGSRIWVPEWPYGKTQEQLIEDPTPFVHLTSKHLDFISFVDVKVKDDKMVTGGTDGELFTIAVGGNTIEECRKKLFTLIKQFEVYPLSYREDLGQNIDLDHLRKLELWLPE